MAKTQKSIQTEVSNKQGLFRKDKGVREIKNYKRAREGYNSQDPRATTASVLHRMTESRAWGPPGEGAAVPCPQPGTLETLNSFCFFVSMAGRGHARPFSSCQQRLNKITEGQRQEDKHAPAHPGQRSTQVLALTVGRDAWLRPHLERQG